MNGPAQHSHKRTLTWPWLVMAMSVAGCGSSATNSDFRTIQRHEATIAATAPRAWDGTTECKAACAAAETTCEAADDICDVARGKHDDDASARCDAAETRCDRAESASEARCDCD